MEKYGSNNQNPQEIDLVYLSKKIRESIRNINLSLFRFFRFLFRNKFIIIGIMIIGFIVGFLITKLTPQIYKNEIVVVPNFQSTDYLYSKIESINNSSGAKLAYKNLSSIKIKEVEDLYNLFESRNLEVFKIITENGKSLDNLLKEEKFAKNYKYHLITIETKDESSSKRIVEDLFADLNSSPYFKERGSLELMNIKLRKIEITKTIEQINEILNKLGKGGNIESKSNFNINTYDQLNAIIDLKDYYTREISKLDTQIIESKDIIYPITTTINIKEGTPIYKNWMVILPLFLFIMFLIFAWLIRFYKKYSQLESININAGKNS